MTRKGLITIYCILIYVTALSQTRTVSGIIIDAKSSTGLGYVTIGIEEKTIGTVANGNGKFLLKLSENVGSSDAVTFSHIGYKTKKVLLTDLKDSGNTIELEPESRQLNEVAVKYRKPKGKKIGRSSKGFAVLHANFFTHREKEDVDRLSKEMGMKFKVGADCRLKSLNFNVTSNEYTSVKFRLNIYKVENGLPAGNITGKDIIFEVKDGFRGWYKLNLEAYDLYIDKETEEFAGTIQWLESVKSKETSKYFSISTAQSLDTDYVYREKAMDRWKKSGQNLSFYLDAVCY